MRDQIEIIEAKKEGYESVLFFESWRIGLITPAPNFTHITYLERHMMTDEAFLLLKGDAVLLHMDQEGKLNTFPMEVGKIYNVPRAVWHSVALHPDALVMVVENADTTRENSEYKDFDWTLEG